MSAFHEWEANQRYNEVVRTSRRQAEWNLEDGRLPRRPGLLALLIRMFRGGKAATGGEKSQEAAAPNEMSATKSTSTSRDHQRAS